MLVGARVGLGVRCLHAAMAALQVTHDRTERAFVAVMDDGARALLEYDLDERSKILDLTHTFTPPSARGKGIAAQLGDAAVAYAREQGYRVRPSCSYISGTYLPKRGAQAGFRVDPSSGLAEPLQ
jgi:predicted GNAT family acetyltransferase